MCRGNWKERGTTVSSSNLDHGGDDDDDDDDGNNGDDGDDEGDDGDGDDDGDEDDDDDEDVNDIMYNILRAKQDPQVFFAPFQQVQ